MELNSQQNRLVVRIREVVSIQLTIYAVSNVLSGSAVPADRPQRTERTAMRDCHGVKRCIIVGRCQLIFRTRCMLKFYLQHNNHLIIILFIITTVICRAELHRYYNFQKKLRE